MVASDGIVLLRGGPRCVWILLSGITSRQTWSLRQTYVEQNAEMMSKRPRLLSKGGLFRIFVDPRCSFGIFPSAPPGTVPKFSERYVQGTLGKRTFRGEVNPAFGLEGLIRGVPCAASSPRSASPC